MDWNKIIDFINKHKILKHVFHLSSVVFLGVCMFLYPIWWKEGLLDGWYPRIGAGIAVYGGFAGHLAWYLMNKKNF